MALIECTTFYGRKKMVPDGQVRTRVSAYGVVMHNAALLVVTMRNTGKYFFPGGEVEKGERLEGCVRREVLEETAVTIEDIQFVSFRETFFYYDPSGEAYHNFSFFYTAQPVTFSVSEKFQVEVDEAVQPQWIPLAQLNAADFQHPGGEVFGEFASKKL